MSQKHIKHRSKSQSQSRPLQSLLSIITNNNHNNTTTHNNSKGHIFSIQPYSQEYLKAKHATYEKTKKLRQLRNQGKQNNPVMFQFNKPKNGFYKLKGCKMNMNLHCMNMNINKEDQKDRDSQAEKQIKKKSEYLNYFLKKYTERKQKLQKCQNQQNILPLVKQFQPQIYVYPTANTNNLLPIDHHSQSVGLQSFPVSGTGTGAINVPQNSRRYHKKIKTQPLQYLNIKNRSCQQIWQKQRQKCANSLIKIGSLTNKN